MRTSSFKLNPVLQSQLTKSLFQVVADLKDESEVEAFLTDFFNQSEFETFVKRLAVAYWLKKGRSYSNIKNNLKVSSATIASVHESLKRPGIVLALKKLEAEEWANVWSEKIKNFTKFDRKL